MDPNGKTILITGSTDGVGAELARQLRDAGATVIASGRDEGRIAASRDAGSETLQADLSTAAGVDGLLAQLDGRPLDMLVNNAGTLETHNLTQGTPDLDQLERVLFVNLHAPIRLIAKMAPMLLKRPEALIVNVSSDNAISPQANLPVYSATKMGLHGYTLAIRHQLKGSSIRVTEAMLPGADTRMATIVKNDQSIPAAQAADEIIAGIKRRDDEIYDGLIKNHHDFWLTNPAAAQSLALGA